MNMMSQPGFSRIVPRVLLSCISRQDTYLSQPGSSRIVPRVLVSCISRQDTYPKCLPSTHMLNDHPGPLYITSKVSRPLQAP
ncbi:uncharacterized protein EURHEDRAFT_349592 [Aspergillus ruber CBS 135680]|uniref:Uncharacterized protein n=1 Tax=Aspergillus ruber (strain CBS 135680) TaxID=1388766 RepID=A0A017SI35_ASPRC|nr:uncharacterized protein EURHEDRAFT_349592 [Aspergillus ruber CBS 135680]EYE96329.1 hypothetical protein EURHEDRAFT_349592 [Aspergillus ruber CBS 135680]